MALGYCGSPLPMELFRGGDQSRGLLHIVRPVETVGDGGGVR